MHDIGRFVFFDKVSDELNRNETKRVDEEGGTFLKNLLIPNRSCTVLTRQILLLVFVKNGGYLNL